MGYRPDPLLLKILKMRNQPFEGLGKKFRKNSGFRNDGNEARISDPSGKDMHVEVLIHSGASRFSNIESYVESFRTVLFAQGLLAPLSGFEEGMKFSGIRFT